MFVNRENEQARLAAWWQAPGPRLAVVWGRRRVGKTALLRHFAQGRRTVFHIGTRRPPVDELRTFARASAAVLSHRSVEVNPFHDWADAIESLAREADDEPLFVVLDEFPELVQASPDLPSVIRAVLDSLPPSNKLRLALCGSAVRTMQAMLEERAPLYGRAHEKLLIHPFRPHEAAAMLEPLPPSEKALVWGIVGGIPLYLQWWDVESSIRDNLANLVCRPGAPLLTEGELVLATEGDSGDLTRQVMFALAAGRTKHNEIADAVRTDPTRTLDRLIELRLVERLTPVTENPHRTRRRLYRIADNFLAFWLGVVQPFRSEIERGISAGIVSALLQKLDDFMGPRFEEAFRDHLRRLAQAGRLAPDVVAIGPYWTAAEPVVEFDAVVLAGAHREIVMVGEAKWAKRVDGNAIARELRRVLPAVLGTTADVAVAVAARETVSGTVDLPVTAADIFSTTLPTRWGRRNPPRASRARSR